MNGIIIALISAGASIIVGVLTFLGVVITNNRANREMQQKMAIAQAVTDTKIEALTREVRKHNNFAQRMPVVEREIEILEHDVGHLKLFHEGGERA